MKVMKIFLIVTLALAMSTFTLATGRPAPVRITQGPLVEGVGDSWAVVAWTTDTGGSTVVRYGTDPNNLSQTAQAPYSDNEKTTAQNHRVHLKGLRPGSTYYFVAVSGQGEGTGTQTTSPIGHFATQGATLGGNAAGKADIVRITDGPRVEGTGSTWAVIAWTTNTGGSSIVRYGTEQNSLNQMTESPYSDNEKTKAQNHRIRLTNLRPNTRYYFFAYSGQGEGTGTEAKSSVGQFTTKAR
jgi:phosphodiesterase/alkaline phosphatase D-like protein